MSGTVPDFFRVSKTDNPLAKLTGITAVKKGISSVRGKSPLAGPLPTDPDPAPAARSIPGRAEDEAKKKVKKRAVTGRQQNILAGRLMSQRGGSLLNTRLG